MVSQTQSLAVVSVLNPFTMENTPTIKVVELDESFWNQCRLCRTNKYSLRYGLLKRDTLSDTFYVESYAPPVLKGHANNNKLHIKNNNAVISSILSSLLLRQPLIASPWMEINLLCLGEGLPLWILTCASNIAITGCKMLLQAWQQPTQGPVAADLFAKRFMTHGAANTHGYVEQCSHWQPNICGKYSMFAVTKFRHYAPSDSVSPSRFGLYCHVRLWCGQAADHPPHWQQLALQLSWTAQH